jgi:mono/diheme cytochrome c family protein
VKIWLRRLGIAAGALVLLLVGTGAGIYGLSARGMTRVYDVTPEKIAFRSDSAALVRGRHVAEAMGKCADCHGEGLKGSAMIDDAAFGRLVASNLTSGKGGVIANYSDEQLVNAIRHGVKPDGKPLLFMPSSEFYYFSDDDLASLIAYIRALPPADNELAPTKLGFIPRMLYVAKKMELVPAEVIDHANRPAIPAQGVTREYGLYLAQTGGCMGCHGPGLSGGAIPGAPPTFPKATNITPTGIGSWTEANFIQSMRSGVRPDGTKIDPFMPWSRIGQLTDDELRALWLHLTSVPGRESGTR